MEGIVIKTYGGYYYVKCAQKIWECVLRGRLRYHNQQILVGDRVQFKPREGDTGVIEELLPRRTVLTRPPVANVDQAIIIFSVREPEPSFLLLDRFLIQAHTAGVNPVVCFNKVDLDGNELGNLVKTYENAGYLVLLTSARTGLGLEKLRKVLRAAITVLAGPSGVGKSSLLNALYPNLSLKTAEVSPRLKRGKHTTRYVELLVLADGGFVVDTPGFSNLFLPPLRQEEVSAFFSEFEQYSLGCQFTSCLHFQEPNCKVKNAVKEGKISATRYHNYVILLKEVMERRY